MRMKFQEICLKNVPVACMRFPHHSPSKNSWTCWCCCFLSFYLYFHACVYFSAVVFNSNGPKWAAYIGHPGGPGNWQMPSTKRKCIQRGTHGDRCMWRSVPVRSTRRQQRTTRPSTNLCSSFLAGYTRMILPQLLDSPVLPPVRIETCRILT